MKKLFIFLFTFFMAMAMSVDLEAQISQRKVRKNRKRMANYKGRKKGFGKDRRYSYFGFSVNAMNYFGDLAPSSSAASTDLSLTKPGFGIFVGHRFGPRYTVRAAFNYGSIHGDDYEAADPNDADAIFRYIRNLQFRNRIKELSLVAMFDLFKNDATYISRVQFTPYIYAGITVLHHNPQAYVGEDSGLPEAGEWVDLQEIGTEGQYAALEPGDVNYGIEPYERLQIAIPAGIGIRYRLNQVMDLSLETGFRYLFTDYLDDVSQNYVDPGVFDNELARYLSDRSQEVNAAVSGDFRQTEQYVSFVSGRLDTFTGRDGNTYTRISGYGSEFPDNVRGNDNDNDLYIVTSLKVSFIIGGRFLRAKFR